MKIEILPKGLFLTYTDKNNRNVFIPFTGIANIDYIWTGLDQSNDYYDVLNRKYIGNFIYKIALFTIVTNDGRKFDIYFNEDRSKFPRISNKEIYKSFWKRFFFYEESIDGLSKEAIEWVKNEKCEDAIKHLTDVRNKIIEAINKG